MADLFKYRLWCTSHSAWEFVWAESVPVSGTEHVYADGSATIIESRESNVVTIQEETTKTGGYYQCVSKRMEIAGGVDVVTTDHIYYKLPISILNIEYNTIVENKGDIINAYIGKEGESFTSNIIGVTTATTNTPMIWAAGDYVADDVVTYTHPNGIFGTHEHTCIADTNTEPNNKTYWREGNYIYVSSTAIEYAVVGYDLVVTNGVTSDHLGEILYIDAAAGRLFFDGTSNNTYTAGSYVKMFRHIVKDVIIGNPSKVGLGRDTIGASYLPAYTVITIEYTNKSAEPKDLTMRISMLK